MKGRVRLGDQFMRWLSNEMRKHNMVRDDLADILHMDKGTVTRHRLGQVMPHFSYVVAYCYAFNDGTDPEDIWNLVQEDWDYE